MIVIEVVNFVKGRFSCPLVGVDLLIKNISKVFTLDDKIDFIEVKMCFEIVRSVNVALLQIVLLCRTLVTKHCLNAGLTISN